MSLLNRENTWDKNFQLLLVAIIAFNIVPHISTIPIWATLTAFFLLAWKTLYLLRGVTKPPRWVLWTIAIGSTVASFAHYRTLIGDESASCLLVLLASAKLLETNRYRDAMFIIFTSYFLLMTHLLSSQSLLSTVFMAVDVLMITALMFHAHKRDRRTSVRSFRPVMRMLAFAIPVWIFLFVAFPRFSAGLWTLKPTNEASTGFSDQLNPGSVGQLASSDAPAFRVDFVNGSLPAAEALYWRGAVLVNGNGLQWSRADANFLRDRQVVPDSGITKTDYDIYLEPKFKKWLFALDYPISFLPSDQLTKFLPRNRFGQIFDTERELPMRIRYRVGSTNRAFEQSISQREIAILSEIPANLDPRVIALAQELKAKAELADPMRPMVDRMSDEVTNWFVENKFRYTRQPGALPGDGKQQLATFLFSTRVGFCEHYAAAFATLMRAAGFPSRVTIGFQGGKLNDVGNYLIVRDLDAHAWAEVWRESRSEPNRGRWSRVDPTSFIAPLRVQLGGDYNLLDGEQISGMSPEEARRRLGSGFILKAQLLWDAAQMRWNSTISNYDFDAQKELLEKLGFTGATRAGLFLIAALGVIAFIASLNFVLRKRSKRQDPDLVQWRKFCAKLERAGLTPRAPTEGPLIFAARAKEKFPESADEIGRVVNAFVDVRYGKASGSETQRSLAQSVRRFSIKSSSRSASS